MSWMSMLSQTYDNCPQLWGLRDPGDPADRIPLLGVGQSTQNAQIDVLLDAHARIIEAHAITDKPSQITVIPCTEGSIGRSGKKVAPHPLHDKLQYTAGDYEAYGGEKVPGWSVYMTQIEAWCDSAHAHPKVKVVRDFLKNGDLIAQLVQQGTMLVEDGKLVQNPTDAQKKSCPLLGISGLLQSDAFVRFRVALPGDLVTELWLDQSVNDSFVAWQRSFDQRSGLCYASGTVSELAENHPSKLRHTGDKAKLISANDSSGYTYRGRFHTGDQAVGISYDQSQKAHNMLKWLISRHGFRSDSQVFVAWGTRLQPLPSLAVDSESLFGAEDEGNSDAAEQTVQTEETSTIDIYGLKRDYADRLRSAMAGYCSNIRDADDVVVMGLDAATPGRMSIIFYREIAGTEFLKRIEDWHEQCSWLHTYKFREKKRVPFVGAPAPKDIALAAYGMNAADKLIKATVERLLRCIVDAKSIPPGLRLNLIRRAGNPVPMERWEWNKTLSIACSVVRKHQMESKGGTWTMALDENSSDRSYLFGRLLAYAQHIESYVQYKTENTHRQTNAERMMHQFTIHPAKSWAQLTQRLQSYFRQLKKPGLVNKWNTEMHQLVDQIGVEGFTNDALKEQYLLGFSSQLLALRNNPKEKDIEEDDNDDAQK